MLQKEEINDNRFTGLKGENSLQSYYAFVVPSDNPRIQETYNPQACHLPNGEEILSKRQGRRNKRYQA
jgi:hypothetical protein